MLVSKKIIKNIFLSQKSKNNDNKQNYIIIYKKKVSINIILDSIKNNKMKQKIDNFPKKIF